ncbi:MAG: hypothetical protein KF764_28045 [Labilithrix sp.]|nr:hypothetical protein [Labilithrix sp.]MBX3219561.1 hypothetical protein [Labilithrix sp.]
MDARRWRRIAIVAAAALLSATSCGRVAFDFPGDGAGADAGDVDGGAVSTPASCVGSEVACGASCVDLASDPTSCGRCGGRCTDPTPVCDRGTCSAVCGDGRTNCGGRCVDTSSDRAHCSACGASCAATDVCVEGQCTCPPGKTRCGPKCVSLVSDPLDCGACGVRCDGATPVCNAGACRSTCTGGRSACAGACIDLRSDPEHCGGCFSPCPNGACTRSECVCSTGQVLCGKRCVDTQNDGNNCGVCGRGCPASTICNGGSCL